MLRIFRNTRYDFIKWWRVAAIATAVFILAGVASVFVTGGIKYSVDFTGGTLIQLQFAQPTDVGQIRAAAQSAGVREPAITQFGTDREYIVRAENGEAEAEASQGGAGSVSRRIQAALTQRFGANSFQVVRTEAVGARVGAELQRGAIIAVLVSFVLTLLYLAIRFEWRFGVSAVAATAHDVLATLAFIKLMDIEISLTVIAAILTVLGYSLNDTIVIFDRVREHMRRMRRGESWYDMVNQSVNETLPRSVLTHATAAAATLALLLFAGPVIRPFAWVMLFGIVTGTFSSVYVASAILVWIERKYPRSATASTGSSSGQATSSTGNASPRGGATAEPRTPPGRALGAR